MNGQTGPVRLDPAHYAELVEESGINPELVEARGYRTITSKAELRKLGFSEFQARVPALVVPMFGPDGKLVTHQIKPDDPRKDKKKGRPVKYETASGSGIKLDVHPSQNGRMQDTTEPLWIVEGVKKADSLASRGVPAVALQGVDCAGKKNPDGVWQPLREWEDVRLHGRTVYVVFDSDVSTKTDVQRALTKLTTFLQWRGAFPKVAYLPDRPDGGKVGADDYLAAGGTVAGLKALADEEREPVKPGPISAVDLLAMEFPPIQWAVPSLIPEGVTILAGKPKMGKSWMALGLAVAVASGGYALGTIPVGKGEALYLGLEDSQRRLKSRLQKVLNGSGPPPGLTLHTEWPGMDDGGADRLDEWLTEHPDTKLVVIDTLKKVRPRHTGNRGIYDVDYEALEPLLPIAAKHGTAILVIHHLNKLGESTDDPYDMISGSTGLTGGVDGALVLTRKRGNADAVLVVDGRDIEESSKLALKWDQPLASWTLIGDAEEHAQSEIRQEINRALADAGGTMGAREVADAIGRDYETVRQRLYQMSKAGEVKTPNRGRYSAVTHNNHNNRNDDNSRNGRNGDPDVTGSVDVTDVMDVTAGPGVINRPGLQELIRQGMSEEAARLELEDGWPELEDAPDPDPPVDDVVWEDIC